jgi:hypothetical protein
MVLETFVGCAEEDMQCRHLDGYGANDRLSNLKWGTRSENEMDKVLHGRSNRGERQGQSILTAAIVSDARRRYREGEVTADIARVHGVTESTLYQAIKGKTWAHIIDPPPCPKGHWSKDAKRRASIMKKIGATLFRPATVA